MIIPTWNRSATLVAAIISALGQTYPPLEVLVCDDGSSDDSEARVRAIADPRVRWLPGARGGHPAIPRNRGIAAARGEWLAFLDSDDAWLPDKLASQFTLLRDSGRRACSTNAIRLVPGAGRDGTVTKDDAAVLDLAVLLRDNRVVCSSALIHKSLIAETGGFPERVRAEDYCLWLRVACFTSFDFLATPCVLYSDDPKNSFRTSLARPGSERAEAIRDFVEWCRHRPGGEAWQGLRAARRQLRSETFTRAIGPVRSRALRLAANVWRGLRRT